jgi:hypothetical protein
MAFQTVFMRYELKYTLTQEQKEKILEVMSPHLEFEKYGRSGVRNIYFDTGRYRLIRRSIEKSAHKEKLWSLTKTVWLGIKFTLNSLSKERKFAIIFTKFVEKESDYAPFNCRGRS